MIKLVDVHITEFRGIRDLKLVMEGESFVVWGPNGSGKSGVVDAIDFALTGDVARLSGAGSGGVTLHRHGPHVHHRDNPQAARVSITFTVPGQAEPAMLTRCVKSPAEFELEPDLPHFRDAIERAGNHPEMTLSRREIIKFIVAEPGKRSAEIQALLKLDRLGAIRAALRTASNKVATDRKAARSSEATAQAALERHLDVEQLLESSILEAVNPHRAVLGLAEFTTLDGGTRLTLGMEDEGDRSAINKGSLLRDLDALAARFGGEGAEKLAVSSAREALAPLNDDPDLLATLQSRNLVRTGLEQVVDERCPLCDHRWEDVEALTAHLAEKMRRSETAARVQEEILAAGRTAESSLKGLLEAVRQVGVATAGLDQPDAAACLANWIKALESTASKLGSVEEIQATVVELETNPLCAPPETGTQLGELRSAVDSIPDETAAKAARTFLTIAEDRRSALRQARAAGRKADAADAAAKAVYTTYCTAQDEGLALLYQEVQDRLSDFYREINDDEHDFKALLEPSAQKLDLKVDFHGEGLFPPVAYHSEGHQDGMGVCLYLALMERLLGDDFSLAILDDVVMSVDVNHRRQFCKMLAKYFPKVQFIVTTHDEVWAKQIIGSLVAKKRQAHFVNWTVDGGPVVVEAEDFWQKIEAALEQDDVPAAAACLRRNLEACAADLAERLRGSVAYRAQGNYDLSEYLSAVRGRYGKILRQAAASADSWDDDAARAEVAAAKDEWSRVCDQLDLWALNPAVHYNEWANFSKADFRPLVDSCREFLSLFECDRCGSDVDIAQVDHKDAAWQTRLNRWRQHRLVGQIVGAR